MDYGKIAEVGAELLVALVILVEVENSRLDTFLKELSEAKHRNSSREIYDFYCGLGPPNLDREMRARAFHEAIEQDKDLYTACNNELAVLTAVGNRLPWLLPFRNRVLRWMPYSVVFLLDILWLFLLARRRDTERYYGSGFLAFASGSLELLLRDPGVQTLILRDPNRERRHDIAYTRDDLRRLQEQITAEIRTPSFSEFTP